MARKNARKSCMGLAVAVAAVAVLAGCSGSLEDPAPERAYWQSTSAEPVVQMDRAPAGRLGLRRPTRRGSTQRTRRLRKAEELFPDEADSSIADAVAKLSGTAPYAEDNVNLDVRPTLAEGFAQRMVESGVWFGVGQMLGGGPVSVAIFAARHWE
jgi:hypothetical protein